jgi:hypothetical protein
LNTQVAKNWDIGKNNKVLESIHQKDINIAILDRDTSHLKKEINHLLKQKIKLQSSGGLKQIINALIKTINPIEYSLIVEDIKKLLHHFKKISNSNNFRLSLATINTNMCRKFHTDINDLRMLCTYSGPGTMWLTDDNVNRKALSLLVDNDSIVLDESKIRQTKTGSVVILKGAIYPKTGTNAITHRSPVIEESGQNRLLLRIDTNNPISF